MKITTERETLDVMTVREAHQLADATFLIGVLFGAAFGLLIGYWVW